MSTKTLFCNIYLINLGFKFSSIYKYACYIVAFLIRSRFLIGILQIVLFLV